MKFKSIMFVSILLLAILAIGTVSASDGHDSDNLTVSNEQTSLDVDKLAVVEDDENLQQEVIKFAEYLCDPIVNDKLSYTAGYLPVRFGAHENWLNDPQYDMIKYMSENSILIPNNQIINKVIPVINSAVVQIIKNQASPEDAAKEALSSLN